MKILFILIILANMVYAQEPSTRVISSNNLGNEDEIWNMLGYGVSSFQVDLMYIYGKLYVTASMPDTPNHSIPTFSDVYLFPLYSNLKKNRNSIVSGDNRESFIIVNIHNEFAKTNTRLKSIIASMRDLITLYNDGWHEGKIRILSKDKSLREKISNDQYSSMGIVGNIEDINSELEYHQMPLIEIDFSELTTWNGVGNIPFSDFIKIKELVNKIHQKGRKLSITNCPNHQTAWDVLVTSKVDFIHTNDPENFCNYLNERK
jgi:hypothetical protein